MLKAVKVAPTEWAEKIERYAGSVFVSSRWIDALIKNGHEPVFLILADGNNQLQAMACGIVEHGGALKGKQLYLYSSPALARVDDELFQQCMDALLQWAMQNRFARISMRPWDQLHEFKVHVSGFRPTVTHEYEIDLRDDYDDASISTRILRNVKKARKAGVQVRASTSLIDLDLLISFLESTKKRRTSKFGNDYTPFYIHLLNKQTITKLLENGMGELLCAEAGGETVSILLMVGDGNRTYNLLKGSADKAYSVGASSLLDVEAIKIYRQRGYKVFNLGVELAEGEGDGLNIYKEGLGGKRITKTGAYTYYVIFPYRLLNIVFLISHLIPDFKWIVWAKQQLSKLFSAAKN